MSTAYDLNEIFDALAAVFNGVATGATIGGVATTMMCLPEVGGQVNPPAMVLDLDDQQFDLNMGDGADTFTVIAALLVTFQDSEDAQRELRSFLSRKPTGGVMRVKAALEANQTLNGLVSYAVMTGTRDIGIATYNNVDYLGAELVIEVVTAP